MRCRAIPCEGACGHYVAVEDRFCIACRIAMRPRLRSMDATINARLWRASRLELQRLADSVGVPAERPYLTDSEYRSRLVPLVILAMARSA